MVVKRKHEEVEQEEKVEAAPSSSRLMQGQGENKHSIDSDDEEYDTFDGEAAKIGQIAFASISQVALNF